VPFARTVAFRYTVTAFVVVVFLFAWIFVGCRKRDLPHPVVGVSDIEKPLIRVLLFNKIKECTLKSRSGFSIANGHINVSAHFVSSGSSISVSLVDGKLSVGESILGNDISVTPDGSYVLAVNNNYYRGKLRFKVNDDGNSFKVINELSVEPYLYGVVGAEMPSYWESEALSAQAVASRTYCLYIKERFGVNREWDVRRTQASQVYRGVSAESITVRSAVDQTNGMVLVYTHANGKEDIFPTYYSSTCGGFTENSKNVFGDSFGPLQGVTCDYCKKVARSNYLRWPAFEIDVAEASSKLISRYSSLKQLGKVRDIVEIDVSKHGNQRRINRFKIIGQNGKSDWLRGEDLRLTLDPTGMKFKSTSCKIEKRGGKFRFYSGKGFGHSVGMCQCGGEAQGRKGKSFDKILGYYYPGSWIVKRY
jgi:stage II sporulation protein D